MLGYQILGTKIGGCLILFAFEKMENGFKILKGIIIGHILPQLVFVISHYY